MSMLRRVTERWGPSRDVGPRDKRADGAPSTQVLSQLWEEAGVVVAEGVTKDVPHAPFGPKVLIPKPSLHFTYSSGTTVSRY